MKILLIDDKARYGWKQVFEKVFPVDGLIIKIAETYDEAISEVEFNYDLIFLDIRLETNDQLVHKVEDFSGFRILKSIRSNFSNINFATPILLVTASNKVWNVDTFKEYGVDAYYIKEHPDYIFDKELSKQNYKILKNNFLNLIDVGKKRKSIWQISTQVINVISKHYYFNESNVSKNVRERIFDKIKLGYSYLFKNETKFEKEILKSNNESLAFIVYWSILEEIVKGFSDISETWEVYTYTPRSNWKFKNKEYFIEKLREDSIRINHYWKSGHLKNEMIVLTPDNKDFNNYSNTINLSSQVYGLLASYAKDKKVFNELTSVFKSVNKFRNKVDYIHSDVKVIFEQKLISKEKQDITYDYCVKVLLLINDILQLI